MAVQSKGWIFIGAEHQGVLGRIEIETYDIFQLGGKLRVVVRRIPKDATSVIEKGDSPSRAAHEPCAIPR